MTSNKFKVADIVDIVNSNILINNGSEMLSCLKDIDGNFDFDIKVRKNNINGVVDLNKGIFKNYTS
ncbi:MAG: hypothetical protein L6V95_15035 [Candidatus Melainabacteria bacterium]|nr:MAG: hypothetical protein L6V95_15035 [Candidatus Melainabacteria bacterium]